MVVSGFLNHRVKGAIMRDYEHLSQEQKYRLYTLKKTGQGQTTIAKAVAVHKSTISREFKRNQGERGYRLKQAHWKGYNQAFRPGQPQN